MPLSLKTLYKVYKLRQKYKKGMSAPVFSSWFITDKCNLRCKSCILYERHPFEKIEPNTDECLKILKQLNQAGTAFLFIAGGEPLLRNDLHIIGKQANKYGINTTIFTNGTLVTENKVEQITKNFDSIVFSIDGLKEINDIIRGKGMYNKAILGLKLFRKASKNYPIYVNCVINKFNISTLNEFIKEMHSLGVTKIKLQPNCFVEYKPSHKQAIEALDKLDGLRKKFPEIVSGDNYYFDKMRLYFARKNNFAFCKAQTLGHPAIFPDGNISACCEFPLIIGNLYKKDLNSILNEQLNQKIKGISKCKGCYRNDYDLIERFFLKDLFSFNINDLKVIKDI